MKKVMLVAMAVISQLGISCQKEVVSNEESGMITIDSSKCIYSYQDLIMLLDTNKVIIRSVVLENGLMINPPEIDIGNITYSAIEEKKGSSVFNSYLVAKWRPNTSEPWQGFTADVWTLGCIIKDPGNMTYTNLLKGTMEIIIHTSFTWNVGPNAGQQIKYLILN